MNVKNFIVGGIVGGLVDFLLGWVFYGMVFKDIFPESEGMRLEFIFAGCMFYGFLVSYIFTALAGITTAATGAKAGAVIGLLMSVAVNCFHAAHTAPDYTMFGTDVLISILLSAGVGAAVAMVNGKMK